MTSGHVVVAPVLSHAEVAATCASIARWQRPDGMIPWFPGGHADAWNHVEAAMALTVGGFTGEAERAYRWLAELQHADGSWCRYYVADGVEDPTRDTNVCAYIATGAFHHLLHTADLAFARRLWPVVADAIGFVLSQQRPGGELTWAVEDGRPGQYALLTGTSSAYFSLRCAVALAEALDLERPEWELAAGRMATAIAFRPEAFALKHAWAMDWYYPVLCGAVGGEAGRERLAGRFSEFVWPGRGCRCIDAQPWVTAAETAECAMAHAAVGRTGAGRRLLAWAQHLRHPDGSYWTGAVHPEGGHYPEAERSTYTAAAVVLANDCLSGTGPAAGLFRGENLPAGLDLDLAALAEIEAVDDDRC